MISLAGVLDPLVKSVCPIVGVSIGRADDKSTWRIDFKPEATLAQRDAANRVVRDFVVPSTQAEQVAFDETYVPETWVRPARQRLVQALLDDPGATQLTKVEWMDVLVLLGVITYVRNADGSMNWKPL